MQYTRNSDNLKTIINNNNNDNFYSALSKSSKALYNQGKKVAGGTL